MLYGGFGGFVSAINELRKLVKSDLKSVGAKSPSRFESGRRHQRYQILMTNGQGGKLRPLIVVSALCPSLETHRALLLRLAGNGWPVPRPNAWVTFPATPLGVFSGLPAAR